MAQNEVWHALIGDEAHGPISRAQMLAYLRGGTLDGNDLVWRPGFEDWRPLKEVREFWRPPARSQQQTHDPARRPPVNRDVVAPPPLPVEVRRPTNERGEKWGLWSAASAGLTLSAATLVISVLTTESYRLASYVHSPTADSLAYLFGYLSVGPILFVVIAAIRNTLASRRLGPSSASAGKRAMIFFTLLVAIVALLKIYGEFYFSRDEVISGEARTDIVRSFLSGCTRSQRAMAPNSTITDAQIDGYCNCVAAALPTSRSG